MTRDALIPIAEVCRQAGLSKTEIYRRIAAGTFPRQTFLTRREDQRHCTARWSEAEVQAWIAERLAARDDTASAVTTEVRRSV